MSLYWSRFRIYRVFEMKNTSAWITWAMWRHGLCVGTPWSITLLCTLHKSNNLFQNAMVFQPWWLMSYNYHMKSFVWLAQIHLVFSWSSLPINSLHPTIFVSPSSNEFQQFLKAHLPGYFDLKAFAITIKNISPLYCLINLYFFTVLSLL